MLSRSDEEEFAFGILSPVPDLFERIEAYITATDDDPTLYVWMATAEPIQEKVARARTTLAERAS